MAPKQATLGYVRDSQTTLGLVKTWLYFVLGLTLYSKFFGKPNGTKPPVKQSTLSFATKSNSKNDTPSSSSAKETEDAEMKDEDSDNEVKPMVEKVEKIKDETLKDAKKSIYIRSSQQYNY